MEDAERPSSTNQVGVAEVQKKSIPARRIAALLSAALWALSFLLAFIIPPQSKLLWVPDTLLLVGFFPLLLMFRAGWPWLVFGLLNVVLGFILEVARFLPDTELPIETAKVRQHLAAYHVPMVWILTGFACTIFGAGRMIVNCFLWIRCRLARKSTSR